MLHLGARSRTNGQRRPFGRASLISSSSALPSAAPRRSTSISIPIRTSSWRRSRSRITSPRTWALIPASRPPRSTTRSSPKPHPGAPASGRSFRLLPQVHGRHSADPRVQSRQRESSPCSAIRWRWCIRCTRNCCTSPKRSSKIFEDRLAAAGTPQPGHRSAAANPLAPAGPVSAGRSVRDSGAASARVVPAGAGEADPVRRLRHVTPARRTTRSSSSSAFPTTVARSFPGSTRTSARRLAWLKQFYRKPPPVLRDAIRGLKEAVGGERIGAVKKKMVELNTVRERRRPLTPEFRVELVEAFREEVALLGATGEIET